MVARIPTLLLAAFVMQNAQPASAQTAPEPIRYTLSFPEPHTHYVEVTAVVPMDRRPAVDLMMAVWTPGSYMVREYARHVEAVTAATQDGRALAVDKSDKSVTDRHERRALGGDAVEHRCEQRARPAPCARIAESAARSVRRIRYLTLGSR